MVISSLPFLIFYIAIWIRWIKLDSLSLWYDDLLSVTFANRPFPYSLYSVLVYDCHPPLYYLLLRLWLVLGKSDFVVLLISVFLNLVAVVLVYHVASKVFGKKHAILSALIMAIHPSAIFWSHFARMYSLLMLLCVACFYANHLYFNAGHIKRRLSLFIVLTELGIVYSHVTGFFILSFIWLYFFITTKGQKDVRRRWVRLHILVGIVGSASLHFPLAQGSLGHMRRPGVYDFFTGLSTLVNGPTQKGSTWVWIAAVLFVLLVLVLALGKKHARRWFALTFLCAPFPLAALISYASKPMWHGNRTFAFLVPFFAIGLALAFFLEGKGRLQTLMTRLLVLAMIVLIARGALDYTIRYKKPEAYASAAKYIQEHGTPDDLVIVVGPRVGWCLKWYLLGPGWDRSIGEEVLSDWPEECSGLDALKCLSSRIRAFDRRVRAGTMKIAVFDNQDFEIGKNKRIWTLTRKDQQFKELTHKHGLVGKKRKIHNFSGLTLTLYEKEDG